MTEEVREHLTDIKIHLDELQKSVSALNKKNIDVKISMTSSKGTTVVANLYAGQISPIFKIKEVIQHTNLDVRNLKL